MDQNPVNPSNGQEYDEFGIPIKKVKTEPEYDEFGIPVKKKELSGSKPVGSPIGSAVGEAAKMAARQPDAPVVSPKLGSIVQKAQGALPQSAKGAVSGLEKGSPSMLKSTSVSEGEPPKTEDLATSIEGTDFEMGAFTEPPGAERVKTRTQFSAGESQARTALYDIQSGKAPNYVSANELEKVIKSGGLDEKQFTDYQKESVDRYNTIKAELQKIEQEYLQSGQERLKAIADKDKEYNEFFRKTQAEVNQFAQTATSQAELDNYIAQKEVELNAVYDKAKERAVKILDAEIQKKFEDIYNRNMPGVDLIEKSGLKNQLDEITNDPNFDILSFDKKKDLLKSMYVTIGNSLAKKGMGDATTLLKLREQLDANYLNKFYISKEEQFTPFALKQYAEQQVPEMEKKLNELNALYKKQQESGNMAGGYYTNEETGEQMPTGEAIVKYKEALRNLQLIQDMPDQKGTGAFSDFVKGFSSVPLAEKTPFLASLIGVGRTGSLYNSATKEQKSEADESLLRTEAMLQDYARQTSDQRSVWYDAGKSTAHSVPFMGEFIMTMGVGRTTVKGLETLAKKKIKDYGESKARRFLLKPLFETIGTVAQTSANPQQVALNTFERMTPEMQLVMSEEGDRLVSKVDQNTGEDFDEAFLKGFGQTWAEFFTERAGSAIPFYTKGLSGQLLRKSPDWVKRAFISLYMRKTGTNITQAYNRLKNVGWDGVLGEFAEEIFIMPLENIITGDYKDPRNGPYSSVLNGIVDPKTGELDERNLKQIAISTTAMTLPMVGGGMIVSALPEGKTSIQMMDVNGNTYQAKLRNSILAQIVAESKKKGNALADFRDTKLSKLDLSMDEMYIANKVIDALENRNAQTRMGGGTLSEADAKLIEELDKLDLETAESETITQVEQPVVSPETSNVDVTMESAPEKAASPETEQIQAQDDSTDITGVSGEVREGQEPIQTQPDETGGREAAETGGVLQSEVQGEELVEVGEAPKKAASPKEIKAELDKRNTDDVFIPVEEGGILGSQNFKKKAQQMFMAFKKVTWDDVYSKRNRKPEYATKQGQRKFEKEFEKWAKENKNQIIAESYVESKANGTNKELVEAVDNLLASPKETKRTKEIRERRQKAQAIIEKRKLQEEKESRKEAGEFRKTVIAESRKAQPTAYRAVLQYFMQGGKVPVVIFEREVSKQKSEIDRRVGINGILERVDVSETDLKRKGLDAIAERIVGDMGVPESSFSDMLSEVVDELKQMMLSVETDTDARALLYDEIEGALSEEEKRAKEGEEEKIYREKKAKEKEGRVEIDEEFTEAELKEMAAEQAELDRVKALENELEERKKKIKELWEKGKSALETVGITGNSWKELGESNADLLKEVSAYVYAYAKLTGAKLKQAIKNVNDELFGGAFDIDEMAASPELIKAHEKGLADKGKTEVEEILEEETTTGEKRKKSTEQRVLEGGKAEPEVILGLIEQGVDYMEQSQDLSRKVADKVVAAYKRKFGDNWKVELESDLDAGVFSESRLGAIPAYLYDLLINSSEGLVKARLINKLSTVLRGFGQFISAMNDIQLRNPDALYAVTIERQRRMFEQILGGGVKGKAVNPRSKLGKIQDAQERLRRAKKESISEAAEKVTSKGRTKKGALSPEKRKERGKKKVDEALEGLKQWLTNPKMSAKMDLNDLYENEKEFNGLILKLADGFFDQGVANAAQLITKMKEALANLGIDEDSFDSIKDRFLSDFDLENKLMDQRREEGAEKLAKKIVNLVKQPKKKDFDPVKQMVETLFGKVKETVTVLAKPKATAEEKIQEALANFYEYREVWEQSQNEVIEQIEGLDISDSQKQAMVAKLAEYLGSELSVPFGEKLAKSALAERYAEKQINSMLDLMDSMGVDLFNVTDEILERFAFSVGINSDVALDLFRKLLNEKVDAFKQRKATAKEKREEAKKIAKEARYKSQAERMAAKDNTPVWTTRKKGVVKSVSNALEKGLGVFGTKATKREQTLLGEFAKDLQKNIMRTLPKEKQSSVQDPIKTLLDAISNFDTYQDVLAETQAALAEKYADNPEALAIFDSYFSGITESSFIEKSASPIVKSALAEKAKSQNKSTDKLIKETLLKANEIQAATREQFVSELVDKLRLDANLTASEAKKIADEFYKEYDKLIEAKKGQILKQTIGADVKAKFARKPEHQRIMEAIKHGALDGKMIKVKNEKGETVEYDSTYLFAEKYGIPDIYNPEIQETLKAFTESIAKLPPNSVQRKIVEREFNTYLDYLKGESKNRWQTFLGMQYANILFDYGTHATIIASNILMTMFNTALKIGRKLVFEQSRIKELGTLGHMMLKGFAKSSLSAKGILLYDTMREGSQVGRKDILRIKSKYVNNKFLRGYFKFLSFSGRVLDALDAFVTVSMTDVEYTDFILDRLNAENKKLPKSERLTNKEIREYAYEIMGQTAPIIEQAENLATEEFKEQYGDDFKMTGKTAVLWKQRVAEIQRELGESRISRPGIPDWVSFTSQDMQRLFEQGTERAGKIGLVGKPAGSIGIVSALLEKMFQNILGGELLVKFLNAGMNSAAFVLKATPVSIVPVVKYYWTGKRGFGTSSSSDKIYEDLGVRREMYGYGGRIEKREELLTWLGFQAMTAIFMGSMFGEQAMTIFKSMFGGDDDDPEKTKNLGVEGRELYFGKKMDGKSGKWKEGLFVTGRMFGDSGNNWRKTQAFTRATGIEPMTVYYKGKKMFTYRNNPVYTAMFGTTGVASDLLLFNDKMDEITQGFMFKVAVSQSLMTLESSPMKGVSEIFALSAMRGDMVNMSDETFQRILDGAIKIIALQTRNAFIPRFLMTMEQDIEGAMSQEDRIDLSWYELATRDWPIVNNLFDREIKYDHFGRPLLRKTKAKSFLIGVPAVDVADGTVYSPVLFDVSNEGEVSSPFSNSVRGGESASEYALFASKGSRAYLLPDGKVVKITGNKGEVKTVKMDKRQYNEFANKVSLRFGDYVRDNFEELSKYPSQREYDKLVEEGKETPYPPFDEVVKDEKNIIIESVLQDMFLGAKEKSYPIRLVTKEE